MTQAIDIAGVWASLAPEAMGGHWARRRFTFDGGRWTVLYRAYGDAQGADALFTLDVGGVYVIGGPAPQAPGAFEAIFPATHRHLIVESQAGADVFAAMGVAIAPGERRDARFGRIGFVPGLMEAMGEYDLVALQDGRLFFGDRAGDLTRARPTTLSPFPLARV